MNDKQQNRYNIAVIGANGGIGRQLVELALAQGHKVTALVRDPSKLILTHENLCIVKADIMAVDSLTKHLQNKDAVISAIGKNSMKPTTLYSQGTRNLLEVLKRSTSKRVFFISASGLEVNPSHSLLVRLFTRFILQQILKPMYADLWQMEAIVKASAIDWTIMRPPQLTNGPLTGCYRYSINRFLANGLKISRADLAHYILHAIENEQIIQTTVEVAY